MAAASDLPDLRRIRAARHATNLETLRRIGEALGRTRVVGFESTDWTSRHQRDLVSM